VFTDKLVAKIPSTYDGVIKRITLKNDEICLVGKPLLEIEVEDGAAPDQSSSQETKVQSFIFYIGIRKKLLRKRNLKKNNRLHQNLNNLCQPLISVNMHLAKAHH
jgi:pyruvate/2-oxoglutarate dehydrogenase complex dihydrolipoamide acyltransferase (E2) component